MTWRLNNGRNRTFIDGIMWIPDGPSSDYSCYITGATPTSEKTFVIEHPIDNNKYLVHACLEGPEAGVYYRGKARINSDYKSVDIYLADYVEHLACDFTVHLTPYLSENIIEPYFPKLISSPVKNGKFKVYSDIVPCDFDYLVFGKRKSIEVEPLKILTHVKGDGPYKWI